MIKNNQSYKKYYKELSSINDVSTLIEYASIVIEKFQYAVRWDDETLRVENVCYLAAVLKRLGEVLDIDKLENNYVLLNSFCEKLSKVKVTTALINSQMDIDTIKDSTSELKNKISTYLEKHMKEANIQEDNPEISEKMLFLAITKRLSKDTYILASNNDMNFGNFAVMIESYKKGENQYNEIYKNSNFPRTDKGKSNFILLYLLEFGAGKCKLRNHENYIVTKKILDYLVNNEHSQEEARQQISRMLQSIYNEHNPYDEEIKQTINSGKEIIFKKRKRYLSQYFYNVIPFFINLINQLPLELQEVMSVITFDDERNPWDIYWEKEYNIDNFFSAATSDYMRKKIDYYSGQWQIQIYSGLTTLAHEAGHAYDYYFTKEWGVTTELISESQLWRDAMQKDLEQTSKTGVSKYAIDSNSSREDFAESISLYIINPNFLNEFPNRKKLLDEKFRIERLHSNSKNNHRK